MADRSKVSAHLSALKMGKWERRYVSGTKMKYLRSLYARAVRRDERRVVRSAMKED